MDSLTKKTVNTKRGFTYTYYVSPAQQGKPTLLLAHGFPDHAGQWETLATKTIVPAGYGVVIPDLLGYDGTSKPTDPAKYAFDGMTTDVCEALDAEGIDKVISVGHDWGAAFAQRFYVHHPERTSGLVLLNVAYLGKVQGAWNLDAMRPVVEQALGYFNFQYWYLFTDPVDGPEIMNAHLESCFDACHEQPEAWLNSTLCKPDGLKNFLLEDRKGDRLPYATDEFKQAWVARMKRDGIEAPLCWYRAMVDGVQYEAEKDLPADRFVVNVPHLFIACSKDYVCLPAQVEEPRSQGLLPQLTIETLDAPHWCMHSNPKEVGDAFLKWLGNNYSQ